MLALLISTLLAAPPITPGEGHLLVGVLSEQGHLDCKGGESPADEAREVWRDLYPEVGFVRLVPPAGFDMDGLRGALVVARGTPAAGPAPARPMSCWMMQARSDWLYGKSGIRVRRTSPPHVAFEARAVEPLKTLLTAERRTGAESPFGDTLRITLANPFDRPLKGLTLTLHHEGCYGKPGTTARAATRAALAPGASWTVELPAFMNRKQGRGQWHAAAAITLEAAGERIAFDLDVGPGQLGVDVACEELRADDPKGRRKQIPPMPQQAR